MSCTLASNRNGEETFFTNNTELFDIRGVTVNFRSVIGTVRFIAIITEAVTKYYTNMTAIQPMVILHSN
jgi:hypothetical protein